ncbi:DNA phosphorothioation-dependent restriction protein DptG [Shewanella sp. NKUCC01_JLK]|uniref:DNA phosphorothioation-dependent restriction protein DptG n=1 Tax=unclassified Shewanella TaxID=196818 RepID=UPI001C5AD138|nr:DNA phosphorothioation-dependent restriction protein DptG [Shewanella sp. NKUCC01_JLK]MBW3513355.1 DNA phosphorothioation-dependent restriction protein DptG [Shewanella sp. NKUCC01_JLK]
MDNFTIIDSSISFVKKSIEDNNDSAYSNKAEQYLPIGPQTLKDHKLDWERVYQVLMEDLFQLSMGDRDKEKLREEILDGFRSARDTRELVDIIDELYLSSNAIRKITPLAYLVAAQDTLTSRTETMINIVRGLLISSLPKAPNHSGNNALETLLIERVNQLSVHIPFKEERTTYLPFLAEAFTKDLHTLATKPSYFLSELESFIKLYSFLYLTQLTIHICLPGNRYNIPTSKPLFFILETERASRERHECNQYGYDYFFSSTRGIASNLFPILGYLSRISGKPSWEIIKEESTEYTSKVNKFNFELAHLFGEEYKPDDSFEKALNTGAAFQIQIFQESLKNSKKGSRKTANKRVIEIFEKKFAAGFIADRKAAGKYFVVNSSILLLLTNMIIGCSNQKKLLIDDVIEGLKERGIWLDLKSKKALLKFYENVGNIEKLSDSGDAVYVKATI